MQEKYLPLGSVVLLKGANKKLMIFGRVQMDANENIYDYVGVLYPEGNMGPSETYMFNHDGIEKVFFTGFSDEEEKEFQIKLKEYLNQKDGN